MQKLQRCPSSASAYYDILRCVLHVFDSVPDRAGEICGAVECMLYAPLLLLSMLKISSTSSHLTLEFDLRPLRSLCSCTWRCIGLVALVALAFPLSFAVPATTQRPIVSILQSPRLCSLVVGRSRAFMKFKRSPSQAGSKGKVQSSIKVETVHVF